MCICSFSEDNCSEALLNKQKGITHSGRKCAALTLHNLLKQKKESACKDAEDITSVISNANDVGPATQMLVSS